MLNEKKVSYKSYTSYELLYDIQRETKWKSVF